VDNVYQFDFSTTPLPHVEIEDLEKVIVY